MDKKRIGLKISYIISFTVWIFMAMPYGENGRYIGFLLTLISIVYVLRTNGYDRVLKNREMWVARVIAAVIDLYYSIACYYQYKEFDFIRKASNYIGVREKFLLSFLVIIGGMISFFSIYYTICFVLGASEPDDGTLENSLLLKRMPICLCTLSIILLSFFSFNYSAWYDETFTIGLIQHSYGEIAILTGHDVHPPLYYWMLKAWLELTGNLPVYIPSFYLSKFFSVIPYYVLILFFFAKLRKYPKLCWVLLCVFCMPNMLEYGVEVRMYSWTLLWGVLAFYEGHHIYNNMEGTIHWILFTAFCLASIYTHYYCGICVIFLYMLLFTKIVRMRTGRKKKLIKFGASTFFLVLGYFPWLGIFAETFFSVSERTWPAEVTFENLFGSVYFLNGYYGIICFLLPVVVSAWINHTDRSLYIYTGIVMPTVLLIIGEIVSALYTPVWQSRYVVVALGVMWLAFGLLLAKQRRGYAETMIMMIIVGFINIFVFIRHEEESAIQTEKITEMVQTNECAAFATDDPQIAFLLATVYDRKCVINGGIGDYLEEIYEKNLTVDPAIDLTVLKSVYTDGNSNVYIVPKGKI